MTKKEPSPHEVRLTPLDTNPVFSSLRGDPSGHQTSISLSHGETNIFGLNLGR